MTARLLGKHLPVMLGRRQLARLNGRLRHRRLSLVASLPSLFPSPIKSIDARWASCLWLAQLRGDARGSHSSELSVYGAGSLTGSGFTSGDDAQKYPPEITPILSERKMPPPKKNDLAFLLLHSARAHSRAASSDGVAQLKLCASPTRTS